MDHVKDSPQIRIEDAVPVFDRKLVQRSREPADPGIVHQDIYPPELLLHLLGQGVYRLLGRHIAGNRLSSVPGLDNRSDSLIERRRGPSGYQHRSSHSSQLAGDRGPNAASRASDDCHLPLQGACFASHRVAPFPRSPAPLAKHPLQAILAS